MRTVFIVWLNQEVVIMWTSFLDKKNKNLKEFCWGESHGRPVGYGDQCWKLPPHITPIFVFHFSVTLNS